MKPDHMALAVSMARKSISRYRLGAVVVRKNRPISTGFNTMGKTHPIMKQFSHGYEVPGTHAEVHSCIGMDAKDLHKADIYVARILKSGETAMAKPCPICSSFLKSVGIRRAYFTTGKGCDVVTFNEGA